MQRAVKYCWQRRSLAGGDSLRERGSLASRTVTQWDRSREPAGVGSMARVDSTAVKVGKVSRVAEACPHSEDAGYKPLAAKSPRARETDGWGRSKRRCRHHSKPGPRHRSTRPPDAPRWISPVCSAFEWSLRDSFFNQES